MSANLKTLWLAEAAEFVGLHPITLAERARAGKVPGASKPGKRWKFLEVGLVAYLNANSPCPYTGAAGSGGSSFPRNQEEFENLLGLPTRKPRRSTTRNARGKSGAKTN